METKTNPSKGPASFERTGSDQPGTLRAGKIENGYAALGMAVSLLMPEPSFGKRPFGHQSGALAGQIRRGHYFFVMNGPVPCGFLGWALATEELAEKWLRGKVETSFEDAKTGDCIVLNAWLANSPAANRFILDQLRVIGRDKKAVYGKRFYKDGRVRPMKLSVNAFVDSHLSKR